MFCKFKMPVTFNQVWRDNTSSRDYDSGGCSAGDISRNRKGRSGDRRHHCINPDTTHISYKSDRTGSNPCTLAGASSATWIGGGLDGRGNLSNFPGKSTNFNNAEAALKCTFNSLTGSKLVTLSRDSKVSTNSGSGAVETNDGFTSQWEQLVYGITTEAGNNTGFCDDVNNLNTQVHDDGRTCYDIIDEALKKTQAETYCESNPTDVVCACYNVSEHGTKGCLKSNNRDLPGCVEVVEGYNKFPEQARVGGLGIDNFPTTCFATGICARPGQFLPSSRPNTCQANITVCTQDINLYGAVQAGGQVTINQDMDCKAGDGPSSDSGPTGNVPRGDGDDYDRGYGEASLSDFRRYPRTYIPGSLDDIKNDPKKKAGAIGISGFVSSIMMMLILLLVVSSGGGDAVIPVRGRFR